MVHIGVTIIIVYVIHKNLLYVYSHDFIFIIISYINVFLKYKCDYICTDIITYKVWIERSLHIQT